MAKLFNTTTIVSVLVALVAYFMFIAPMMTKKSNGNGAAATDPATA